jgi:hypothetical protein
VSFQYIPLGGGMPKGQRANQRALVRYQCAPATPGRILLSGDHELQNGWVLDLSLKGVGLLLSKPIQTGTFLVIQIKGSSRNKTYDLGAHVAHATLQTSGDWLVGCELVKPLVHEDLDDLL